MASQKQKTTPKNQNKQKNLELSKSLQKDNFRKKASTQIHAFLMLFKFLQKSVVNLNCRLHLNTLCLKDCKHTKFNPKWKLVKDTPYQPIDTRQITQALELISSSTYLTTYQMYHVKNKNSLLRGRQCETFKIITRNL